MKKRKARVSLDASCWSALGSGMRLCARNGVHDSHEEAGNKRRARSRTFLPSSKYHGYAGIDKFSSHEAASPYPDSYRGALCGERPCLDQPHKDTEVAFARQQWGISNELAPDFAPQHFNMSARMRGG